MPFMPSFWKHVNLVLQGAEIVIEVLDARMVEETRNKEIEDKITRLGKKIIYAITKSDLVDKQESESWKRRLNPCVFISGKDRTGTTILKKKILEISRGQNVIVGVVGYPNVGKSSLINALAGRHKTRTSTESGYTKGLQKVRVGPKITLLDTPGVFPNLEKDLLKHGKIGAIDYSKIKDPELAALQLINDEKKLVLSYYQVTDGDPEQILEQIAIKHHRLRKGQEADLEATARLVLKDWQTGRINLKAVQTSKLK